MIKKRNITAIVFSLLILVGLIIAFENPSNYQNPLGEGTSGTSSQAKNLPTINSLKIIFGENSASGDYEAAKLIKNKYLTDYNAILIRDVDYQDDGKSSIISIGGSCINKISAQLLSTNFPTCSNSFTTKTKVKENQYLIKASQLSNNRIAIVIAGYEVDDTWRAANYFNSLNINNITTDLNIIKNTSLMM